MLPALAAPALPRAQAAQPTEQSVREQAASPALARTLRDLVATYGAVPPSALACLEDGFEACIAHLRFPLAHRRASPHPSSFIQRDSDLIAMVTSGCPITLLCRPSVTTKKRCAVDSSAVLPKSSDQGQRYLSGLAPEAFVQWDITATTLFNGNSSTRGCVGTAAHRRTE